MGLQYWEGHNNDNNKTCKLWYKENRDLQHFLLNRSEIKNIRYEKKEQSLPVPQAEDREDTIAKFLLFEEQDER